MNVKRFDQDAKNIVDTMFEAKMFHDDVTRDNMATFEELLRFLLQSRFDAYKRLEKLSESIKKL